jgi:hypothetical protein
LSQAVAEMTVEGSAGPRSLAFWMNPGVLPWILYVCALADGRKAEKTERRTRAAKDRESSPQKFLMGVAEVICQTPSCVWRSKTLTV